MPEARRDENYVTSIIGQDPNDPTVTNYAKVDGVTGRLLLRVAATGGATLLARPIAPRDENRVTAGMALRPDLATMQAILSDADGNLFVSAS